MGVFDDEVREGTRQILQEAGSLATYTPTTGDPVSIAVIVDRDIERTVAGMQGAAMERRTELTGYSAELGEARRGETVIVGSETWRLVSREADDGHLVTWIVTPDRS
ncbi:hypothetical protein EQG41_20665 [Billgrantia azerbaijanica]|nr:hypothetical protein EQG41_20665 [Halomonas azerbaijanica]